MACNPCGQAFFRGKEIMALDRISDSYTALFASMRPKGGNGGPSASADFATFLPDEAARASRHQAIAPHSQMVSRILQVGLQRYIEEQLEVDKVMRILSALATDAEPEIKRELAKIINQFKQDPPLNGADAIERIGKHIDDIQDDPLRMRMKKVLARIEWLMQQPDDVVEKLEEEARRAAKKEDAAADASPIP
jgi:hypothetical protein